MNHVFFFHFYSTSDQIVLLRCKKYIHKCYIMEVSSSCRHTRALEVIKMSVNMPQYPYPISNKLVKGCRQILEASKVTESMDVTIITVTSYHQQHIVNSYYQAALDLGAEATIIMNEPYQPPGIIRGPGTMKVPKVTETAIRASDLIITMGINIFGSPLMKQRITEKKQTFFGYNSIAWTEWLIINYPPPCEAVVKRGHAGAELLTKGSELRYTTPAGTDLTMGIKGIKGSYEIGFLEPDKGHVFDILGGAGIYSRFEPESSNGTYVIVPGDFPAPIADRERGFPYTGDKITFKIKDGKITEIAGGTGAKLMKRWFESWNDERMYILDHMGIGTDPRMRNDFERYPFYGVAGWDAEWIEGLLCLGVGNIPSHLDMMQRNGSAWIDGEKILDDEKFVGLLSDEALGIKKEPKRWNVF